MTTVTDRPDTSTDGPDTSDVILDARGLTKAYGSTTVLHGVDLQIREGDFVTVMGPSGSGKSTLLHTASGMDTPTAGSVRIGGTDLTTLDQKQLARLRLTTIGFIFQNVHLLKNLTLLDNVVLPAYFAGRVPRAELNQRGLELMKRTGVGNLGDRDISEASGGQLQRVGICRALINEPVILMGDEPTGALDSRAADEVMDILAGLNADGMTILLVTHDTRVAARSSRVLYMLDGHIVADRAQQAYHGGSIDVTGAELDARHVAVTQWLLEQRGEG